MQFPTADAVFLTVAVTGVIFLFEIGIFILVGMIWSTVEKSWRNTFPTWPQYMPPPLALRTP
jgi:hypothetical protein